MKVKYILLFLLLAVGYTAGVMVPLMDNDAAHHAAIALEMNESGNPSCLMDVESVNKPYLDKPHFQMWAVAASFEIFGVSGIVYKLSSLIFVLLAIFSTYKLGEFLAPKRNVGLWSAIILASMTGFILNSSVDIRMDAIITGAVALALWQGIEAISSKGRFWNCIFAALGMAIAFSTKGLYGVVIPAVAYLSYMIGTGRLKWLLSWQFFATLAMFGVMICPVLIAYYNQFGGRGVSFILYGQIFSRIWGGMGSSSANDPVFFLHTILWVLLPWSAMFYIFLVRTFVKRHFDVIFWATIPTCITITLLLSLSVFKLPHYLNPLFPLMAIFIAYEFLSIQPSSKLFRGIAITQKVIVGAIIIAVAALNYWAFAFTSIALGVVVGVGLLWLTAELFRSQRTIESVAILSATASAVMWVALNMNFYPQLITYQAGNVIGQKATQMGIDPGKTYLFDVRDFSASFEIYHGASHKRISKESLLQKAQAGEQFYIYVEQAPKDSIDSFGLQYDVVTSANDYRITRLSGKFLNPNSRQSLIGTTYLLKFNE